MAETKYLTVAEAAQALRVSKMTIHRWLETQGIAHVRIGGTIRIPAQAWSDFLRTHTTTSDDW